MSRIKTNRFRIKPGANVDFDEWPTLVKPVYGSNGEYADMLHEHVQELRRLQEILYASNTYALLIIFQAMDAAGKDSVIEHVMSGVNPQGCQVHSFKHPSANELDHDFLWRTVQQLPERGNIGIFNRSYYEEVLIVRVHPELLKAENLPSALVDKQIWKERFRSIADLERHLHVNGTRVVKFFLNVSPDEQRKRFLARLDDPDKIWKFNAGDIEERKYWKEYMRAYADALRATSTRESPWYAIPADDKKNARLIISRIIIDTLESLNLQYPKPPPAEMERLAAMREQLKE